MEEFLQSSLEENFVLSLIYPVTSIIVIQLLKWLVIGMNRNIEKRDLERICVIAI
jgi:hypothetical protein